MSIRSMRKMLASVLVVVSAITTSQGNAEITVPKTEGITRLATVHGQIAAYDSTAGIVRFFARRGDALVESSPQIASDSVWEIAEIPDGFVVASGMGRATPTAPLRITRFGSGKTNGQVVFERSGERNQVTFLKFVDGKVWLTFFESKYTTKTGYLEETKAGPWRFVEVASFRMGDVTDVRGDTVVVGRPYGDVLGQDGDLNVVKGGQRTLLPSYRGVRALRLFGSNTDPRIVIGDGWHQNYGEFAQGRVSVLTRNQVSTRYALEVIDNDATQYGFSKFIDLVVKGEQYLLGVGNKHVVLYGPEPRWERTILYSFSDPNVLVDVALLDVSADGIMIAVADGGLTLRKAIIATMPSSAAEER